MVTAAANATTSCAVKPRTCAQFTSESACGCDSKTYNLNCTWDPKGGKNKSGACGKTRSLWNAFGLF